MIERPRRRAPYPAASSRCWPSAYVDKIFRFLVEMKRQGLTILLSEQNARKALQYADRGYVLDLGVTVMEGPARQLADDPEVRRAYLGGE